MLKLEPMNPTEKPARSPVLNGVWEFLYTGGSSPGTLAVQACRRRRVFSSFGRGLRMCDSHRTLGEGQCMLSCSEHCFSVLGF